MVTSTNQYQPGDLVIYTKSKYSTQPGPRAQNVSPAQSGDSYAYTVDKFWTVSEVRDDGRVVLHTRRGKKHVVDADDPGLRLASWWKRWLYRNRFPDVTAPAEADTASV